MNPYRTREVHPPPVDGPFWPSIADIDAAYHPSFKHPWVEEARKIRIEWARKNECEPWA